MSSERLNYIKKLKRERPDFEVVKNADHGERWTKVGDKCNISSSAVIGIDGFGWERDEEGVLERFPHYGYVDIGHDVEIRGGVVIDRGSLTDTVIGDGTKIDDLVHIAHNVKIGKHCLIHSFVNIAGSVEIGDFTEILIGTAIADHIKIGKHCTIGTNSFVNKDIPDNSVAFGTPARIRKK